MDYGYQYQLPAGGPDLPDDPSTTQPLLSGRGRVRPQDTGLRR